MDRSAIATATREHLHELKGSYVTGTVLVNAINRSCRRINRLTKINKVEATVGIRTGARQMSLGTAIMDIYRVRLGTGSQRKRLIPISMARLDVDDGSWEAATAGTPSQYYTDGLVIGFNPRPRVRASWVAGSAYSVGDLVVPTAASENGFYYKCTVAGTASGTAPTWPTTISGTVSDGDVTWQQAGSTRVYLKVLESPSPLANATSSPDWCPVAYQDSIAKGAAIDLAGGFSADIDNSAIRRSGLYQEYLEEVNSLKALGINRSREYQARIRPTGYATFRSR
ncbi:MAG: hypothetical protein WC455_11930 [Dehalococcoidia bacterium]|jgi:hypothetical protein